MKKFLVKIIFLLIIFLFPCYILVIPSIAFSPSSQTIYDGIDVSAYQGDIDYNQVRDAGISIVYIKSSEGSGFVDPYFEQNYQNAKQAGLKVGFYHYVTARSVDEAIAQANFFAQTISGKQPDCKLAMDFESFGSLSNEQINQISLAFLQRLQEVTGKEVIVYSDEFNANNTFNEAVAYYALWVAQYDVSEPTVRNNWSFWEGWQYTDQGEITGISSYVDRDKFTSNIFLSDSSNIPEVPSTTKPSTRPNNGASNFRTIIIPSGATLAELAIEYNTTIERLVELNNISNPNLIYAGNTLVIPVASQEANNNVTSTTAYVVKSGDTLSKIAEEFGSTVEAIANINNITNVNLIFTGELLYVPTTNTGDMSHNLYVVKRGDTLWGISRKFGVSLAQIIMLNRISNPNLIFPGNVLRI